MGMAKEFKDFALKGNVVDMAVGIIIGAAFGKIVSSLVSDIIMPPIGVIMGGVNFSDLSMVIKEAADGAEAVTLNYGAFIQNTLDFVIVAFAIFMMIRLMNNIRKKEEAKPAEPAAPSKEETLLTEIRDLLRKE